MTSEMVFECLFVSSDSELFRSVSAILGELSISVQICLRPANALDVLRRCHSDLVVIDWDCEESGELLQRIWQEEKSKRPTLLAISSDNSRIPGAHIVLRKPISHDNALASFKTAYRRMLIDHRKHVRHALMIPVTTIDGLGHEIQATITDISDGGIGICTREKLALGDVLQILLRLPGAPRDILLHVRIAWTRDFGRTGCEFLRIPPVDLMILHDWLKLRSPVKKPRIAV